MVGGLVWLLFWGFLGYKWLLSRVICFLGFWCLGLLDGLMFVLGADFVCYLWCLDFRVASVLLRVLLVSAGLVLGLVGGFDTVWCRFGADLT